MRAEGVSDDQQRPVIAADVAYKAMLLMRRFEEKAGQFYALGVIADELKLCIGREALIFGLLSTRHARDELVFGRRCHGALLGLGCDPASLMHELAKSSDGAFAPDHIAGAHHNAFWPEHFFRCANGNLNVARWVTGRALARPASTTNPSQNDCVIFTVLDGDQLKTDASEFMRLLHLAKRLKLALVFVIDDATPDRTSERARRKALFDGTSIAFEPVDGIDHQCVAAASDKAARDARMGAGPQGLWVSTQAFRGHASPNMSPRGARGASTVADPVVLARQRLVDSAESGEEASLRIETDVRMAIAEASRAVRP